MLNPLAEQSAIESEKSSKYQMLRRWSTPTVSNYGINRLYEQSDKRMWFHRCPHCGYEQVLDYDKNIKLLNPDGVDREGRVVLPGTYEFVCQKCGKPLDRWYGGHWEATAPASGRVHGYRISQMDAIWVSADSLKEAEMRAPSKQFFYNYTLGYPYQDKSIAFHDEDVLDHIDHNYKRPLTRNGYKLVATGIDWGAEYHHVVTLGMRPNGEIDLMNLTRVPKSTGVEHIEEDLRAVVQVLRQYEPDIILPDRGYSGNYVDLLAKAFGQEHVFGVVVRSALSNGDPSAHFNESDGTVTIDKLTQNVITMGNVKRGDIHFWEDSNHDQEVIRLINHAKNVIIRTDERENKQTHLLEYDKVILRKGGD